MVINKLVSFAVLLLLLVLSQAAVAIPVGGVLEDQNSVFFDIAGGLATVQSQVYSYESGDFIYCYEITNNSLIGLSFFSVGIIPGSDAFDCNYDTDTDVVYPAFWSEVGSPVQSVDGIFMDTLDNDGLSSAVLWFRSSYSQTMGSAVLFGTMSGIGYSASGDVLAPSTVPEQSTILLLGIGGAVLTLNRKRRHS